MAYEFYRQSGNHGEALYKSALLVRDSKGMYFSCVIMTTDFIKCEKTPPPSFCQLKIPTLPKQIPSYNKPSFNVTSPPVSPTEPFLLLVYLTVHPLPRTHVYLPPWMPHDSSKERVIMIPTWSKHTSLR
jgi:hypothetical protein